MALSRVELSVVAAVGEEVRALSDAWSKSVTVSTTRSLAAWARVMRLAKLWLS